MSGGELQRGKGLPGRGWKAGAGAGSGWMSRRGRFEQFFLEVKRLMENPNSLEFAAKTLKTIYRPGVRKG